MNSSIEKVIHDHKSKYNYNYKFSSIGSISSKNKRVKRLCKYELKYKYKHSS